MSNCEQGQLQESSMQMTGWAIASIGSMFLVIIGLAVPIVGYIGFFALLVLLGGLIWELTEDHDLMKEYYDCMVECDPENATRCRGAWDKFSDMSKYTRAAFGIFIGFGLTHMWIALIPIIGSFVIPTLIGLIISAISFASLLGVYRRELMECLECTIPEEPAVDETDSTSSSGLISTSILSKTKFILPFIVAVVIQIGNLASTEFYN